MRFGFEYSWRPLLEALADVGDRFAEGEERGDHRTDGRAADEIEVIREHEIGFIESLAQRRLDLGEEAERDDATRTAAIEGEDAFRAGCAKAGGDVGWRCGGEFVTHESFKPWKSMQ